MTTADWLKTFMTTSVVQTEIVTLNSIESKFVSNSNFSYTTARNAVNCNGIGNNVLVESRTSTSVGFAIRRTCQLFDLSSITTNIVSANLYIIIANNSANLSIQRSLNTGTLVLSDYSNFNSTLLGDGTIFGTNGVTRTIKIVFNSNGITQLNTKGIQRFIIRDYNYDYISTQPVNESFSVTTTAIPYLEITKEI